MQVVNTIPSLRGREGGTSVVQLDIVANRRLPGAMVRACVGHRGIGLVAAIICVRPRAPTGTAMPRLSGGCAWPVAGSGRVTTGRVERRRAARAHGFDVAGKPRCPPPARV